MQTNSFELVAATCAALALDPLAEGLQLLDAAALLPAPTPDVAPAERAWSEMQQVGPYTPPLLPFPLLPTRPALLCRLHAAQAPLVAAALQQRYPAAHPVVVVSPDAAPRTVSLSKLGSTTLVPDTCAYLAPLAPLDDLRGAEGPTLVVARLLGPRGCPWDREQTPSSLRSALLEETHEVLEALDAGDDAAVADELGDVLLQVLMHSEMARQAGTYNLGMVYANVAEKLIRRHPHIFGTVQADTSDAVLVNWEAIKRQERADKGQTVRGALDGVPVDLPALATAQKITRKAAKQGFDGGLEFVWGKLREELAEVEAAVGHTQELEQELGDLLQIIATLAWHLDVDAESALRSANGKFRRRYARVEQQLRDSGQTLSDLPLAERIALWEQAKVHEA